MKTFKLLAPLAAVLGLLAAPSVASADTGAVHNFLRGPIINPAAATLRIVPPSGGQVMLHREGKAARWFVQTGLVQVEPGVTYEITAVRNNAVVFNSGIVARPGVTDIVWNNLTDAPDLTYHAPMVVNPFGMGLVPFNAVSVQALRTPVTAEQFSAMLDDVQAQLNDHLRWLALSRYTQGLLFNDEQIQGVVDSFDTPRYPAAVARLLARRHCPTE